MDTCAMGTVPWDIKHHGFRETAVDTGGCHRQGVIYRVKDRGEVRLHIALPTPGGGE